MICGVQAKIKSVGSGRLLSKLRVSMSIWSDLNFRAKKKI
jgi:hypothetical protein